MTVAVDPHTNKVLGQVVDRTPALTLERDPRAVPMLLILGKEGWKSIAAASVRLEEV